MIYMFDGCESLTSLNIINFETSKIKSMDNIFADCFSLETLDLSNFNTNNVISMDNLFSNCKSLIFLNLSNFNTTQTKSMSRIFSGCKSLKNLEIFNFNTSSITTMEYFFNDCSSLKILDLFNFDTSLVTDMKYMFKGCSNLTSLNIKSFNTSKVKTMKYMFSGCSSMTDIDTKHFDVSLVTEADYMFENCSNLTSLNLSNYEFQDIKNMDYMFSNCENLAYVNFLNLVDNNINSMVNIFSGTPENMVICINESNSQNLDYQINKIKGCSVVNCSDNWSSSRKKVIAGANICVEECNLGYKYFYQHKCYERCPEGTFSVNHTCIVNLTDNDECTIKGYFLGKCVLKLNTNELKQKFIESTVRGITNSELYELLQQATIDKKIHTIIEKNETYQIYSLSNKRRVNGTSHIDLDKCGKILKERHYLKEGEDLVVFKIEYKYTNYKIPIIEYQIFNENGKKKLNLNYCKNIKIPYYITLEINNYLEYQYNPMHEYYNDRCSLFETNHTTDILLYDRKNEFNQNNMSLCENGCIFKGYINNVINCECEVKLKFNSFLNVNSDKYNLIYRFEIDKKNSHNFWTIKCFLDFHAKYSLLLNINFIFMFSVLFVFIIALIVLMVKEYRIYYIAIRHLAKKMIMMKKVPILVVEDKEKNIKKIEEKEYELNKVNISNINNLSENENEEELNGKNKEQDTKEIKYTELNGNQNNDNNIQGNTNLIKTIFPNDNDKNQIMNINCKIKRRMNKKINDVAQNNSMISSNMNSKKSIIHENKSNSFDELVVYEKKKHLPDEELNDLDYEIAKIEDKRTFLQYYFSLIKTRHILFIFVKRKNDLKSNMIKFCYLLFMLPLHLSINTMFVDSSTIHNIYINNGAFDFKYNFAYIFYATIIIYILNHIIYYFITIHTENIQIKKNLLNVSTQINKIIHKIIGKIFFFFSICILLIIMSGLYLACFTAIFPKIKFHLFIRAAISLMFTLIFPLLLHLITAAIRIWSLKKSDEIMESFYKFSKVFQLL